MIEVLPRYNFDTGIIDRRYYDYEIACSKGVEAFNKNREESPHPSKSSWGEIPPHQKV